MGKQAATELSLAQEKCIEMLIDGSKMKEIEDAIGYDRKTIWEWKTKNKMFIAEMHKRRQDISEFLVRSANKRFEKLQDSAIEVLENLLKSSNNDNVKKETAQYIIERNIGKIPTKTEVKDTTGEQEEDKPVIENIDEWDEDNE